MEHLDEILERLMNKPKPSQTTIFDSIADWKDVLYDEIKDKDKYDTLNQKRKQMNVMEGFIQLEEDIWQELQQERDDWIDQLNEDFA